MFICPLEKQDVHEFLLDNLNNGGILELMMRYLKVISQKFLVKWPPGLCEVVLSIYNSWRKHSSSLPNPLLRDSSNQHIKVMTHLSLYFCFFATVLLPVCHKYWLKSSSSVQIFLSALCRTACLAGASFINCPLCSSRNCSWAPEHIWVMLNASVPYIYFFFRSTVFFLFNKWKMNSENYVQLT